MTDAPQIYFDPPLPSMYQELIDGRATASSPDDPGALSRAVAAVVGINRRWDAAAFAEAPALRVISRTGIGYDNVDVADAAAAGVVVCNAPEAPSVSTAEHTVALMMALTKRLSAHAARATEGLAGPGATFGLELDGRTLGLVGFGRIARRVAAVGTALGMRVIAHDPFLQPSDAAGVELVTLDELWAASDVVSLHAPATAASLRMVNAASLAAMRQGAFLVNCARGSLVDHDALLDALDTGHLGGAALDVTDPEPLPAGHRLLSHPLALVTPHVASSTAAGRRRLFEHAIDNALAVLDGRPATVVAPPPV